MENDFGTIRITAMIPAQKIEAAALLLAEEYKPLVVEALEAPEGMYND